MVSTVIVDRYLDQLIPDAHGVGHDVCHGIQRPGLPPARARTMESDCHASLDPVPSGVWGIAE